jgi:hypothetical protein
MNGVSPNYDRTIKHTSQPSFSVTYGKVIKIHRDIYAVDLVLPTGEIHRRVPVSFPAAGTKSGEIYLQRFSDPQSQATPYGPISTFKEDRDRTIYALVTFISDDVKHPVVLGFVLPLTTQMLFNRPGFSLKRHESDLYTMIENGSRETYESNTDTTIPNWEFYHPSGFFARVGEGTTHEDLTKQDVQGLARFRGTPNANTSMRSAGPDTADYVPLTLKHPSGTGVTINNDGILNIQTGPTGQAQVNGCRIVTVCDLVGGGNVTITEGPGDTITISAIGGGFYTLPVATPTVLGGIKIGSGLSIDGDGVVSSSPEDAALTFVINYGAAIIETGIAGDLIVPFNCQIISVTLLADVVTNLVIDIWKTNYAGYPPTVGNSITAGTTPTITGANKSQDTSLIGWTTSLTTGDVIRFNVNSVTLAHRVSIVLEVLKT